MDHAFGEITFKSKMERPLPRSEPRGSLGAPRAWRPPRARPRSTGRQPQRKREPGDEATLSSAALGLRLSLAAAEAAEPRFPHCGGLRIHTTDSGQSLQNLTWEHPACRTHLHKHGFPPASDCLRSILSLGERDGVPKPLTR